MSHLIAQLHDLQPVPTAPSPPSWIYPLIAIIVVICAILFAYFYKSRNCKRSAIRKDSVKDFGVTSGYEMVPVAPPRADTARRAPSAPAPQQPGPIRSSAALREVPTTNVPRLYPTPDALPCATSAVVSPTALTLTSTAGIFRPPPSRMGSSCSVSHKH